MCQSGSASGSSCRIVRWLLNVGLTHKALVAGGGITACEDSMNTRDCRFYPDFFSGHESGRPRTDENIPPSQGWPEHLQAIVALVRAGRYAQASASLAKAFDMPVALAPLDSIRARMLSAHVQLCLGEREDGLTSLRRVFALAREHGTEASALCQPVDIFSSLCAVALEEAIEPVYVGRLVKQADIAAPSPALVRWPYPIRFYTLGRAAVVVDGLPLRSTGKAQRRPMLLLHCLLARGGREVPVHTLLRTMAEERDEFGGRESRGAFDMALSRLRRMLGHPDALHLGDAHLSLNEALCWVDAWACERLLGHVDQAHDPACGRILFERALGLYQGDFLEGEESAWTVLARERMRSRLLRVARRLGESFEREGAWAEAGELYARLRELFPLDEELCRHLIRSHVERDDLAQAAGIYGRCREVMAKVLGVLPSASIRALFDPARN